MCKVLFDTDIISIFAKIDRLELLKKVLPNKEICISQKVREELSVSLEYGYKFPRKIFAKFETVLPSKNEMQEYNRELEKGDRKLGKGEIESIIICKKRKYFFASADDRAIIYAQKKKVEVITLRAIFQTAIALKIPESKEVRKIIEEIEKTNNRDLSTLAIEIKER